MTSRKQLEANRRNAAKSTGPRTDEGKKNSSMNALKWGLSSPRGTIVLPGESVEEFEAFRDALLADLAPVGALQEELVRDMVEECWRLRRAATIDRGILLGGVADADERYLKGLKPALRAAGGDVPGAKAAEFFHGQQTIAGDTTSSASPTTCPTTSPTNSTTSSTSSMTTSRSSSSSPTSAELLEYAKGRFAYALEAKGTDEARLANAFASDAAGADAMAKLSRYETAHRNARNQDLALLLELQARSSDTT